jgi:hypothetical protein
MIDIFYRALCLYSSELGVLGLHFFPLRNDIHLGIIPYAYYVGSDVLVDFSFNSGVHLACTI